MKAISPSNICALLAKWRYKAASLTCRCLASTACGDALGTRLLQQRRQRPQDLFASLAGQRTLARNGRRRPASDGGAEVDDIGA